MLFKISDEVIFNGFTQPFTVIAIIKTIKGEIRIVVENKDEFLHIFKEDEIELK